MEQIRSHCFTVKSEKGKLGRIIMPIGVAIPGTTKVIQVNGLWDTGASATVINENIVKALGLITTGKTKVNTASEIGHITDTFIVDIFLKQVKIQGVNVTLGKLGFGVDCLIGMDIISLGDFSITNFNGTTCMSFRIPSLHHVDFVEEGRAEKAKKDRRNILYKGHK